MTAVCLHIPICRMLGQAMGVGGETRASCSHLIKECKALSPGSEASRCLLMHTCGDSRSDCVPITWLLSGQSMNVVGIWGVNQQEGALPSEYNLHFPFYLSS